MKTGKISKETIMGRKGWLRETGPTGENGGRGQS